MRSILSIGLFIFMSFGVVSVNAADLEPGALPLLRASLDVDPVDVPRCSKIVDGKEFVCDEESEQFLKTFDLGDKKPRLIRASTIISSVVLNTASTLDVRKTRQGFAEFPGRIEYRNGRKIQLAAFESNTVLRPFVTAGPVVAYGTQIIINTGIIVLTDKLIVAPQPIWKKVIGWTIRGVSGGIHIQRTIHNQKEIEALRNFQPTP